MVALHDNLLYILPLTVVVQLKGPSLTSPLNGVSIILAVFIIVYYATLLCFTVVRMNALKPPAVLSALFRTLSRYAILSYYQEDLTYFSKERSDLLRKDKGKQEKRKMSKFPKILLRNYHLVSVFRKVLTMVLMMLLDNHPLGQLYLLFATTAF